MTALAVLAALAGLSACSSTAGTTSPANGNSPDGSFCSLLVAFQSTNESTRTDSADPAQNRAAITNLVSQAALLQKKAPADIKPDVDVAATYLQSVNALLGKYGYDLAKVQQNQAATEAFAALTTDAVNASRAALVRYASTTCASAATAASGAAVPDTT